MHRVLAREKIYLVGASRTPVGSLDGILANIRAPKLGSVAITGALAKALMNPTAVDEVFLGNVVAGGLGQAPAKQASVGAGIPEDVPATLVNTVCSSAMTAVITGVNSMLAGTAGVVVAGGMESQSTAPYLLGPKLPDGSRLPGKIHGHEFALRVGKKTVENYESLFRRLDEAGIKEANIYDGLVCPFNPSMLMAEYAIAYCQERGWNSAFVNTFAAESHRKAHHAQENGFLDEELSPVGEVRQDELIQSDRLEVLREWSNSVITPYNCPGLGDNAAAVVLVDAEHLEKLDLKPLARLVGYARVDCGPADFVTAPLHVIDELRGALTKAKLKTDWPIMEVNESFGMQLPLFVQTWPDATINVHGGAVAFGHPLGSAGVRILVTLLYAMKRYDHKRGIAAICFGSGGATAVALER